VIDTLAAQTEGYTGADLQAVLYNAHLAVIHEALDAAKAARSLNSNHVNGESKAEYLVLRDQGSSMEGKSLADKQAFQRRIENITKWQQQQRDKDLGIDQKQETAEKAPNLPKVTWEHIEKSLKTTRSSVPPQERERLRRIYAKFVGGRDGKLQQPPEGEGVGVRLSLA